MFTHEGNSLRSEASRRSFLAFDIYQKCGEIFPSTQLLATERVVKIATSMLVHIVAVTLALTNPYSASVLLRRRRRQRPGERAHLKG